MPSSLLTSLSVVYSFHFITLLKYQQYHLFVPLIPQMDLGLAGTLWYDDLNNTDEVVVMKEINQTIADVEHIEENLIVTVVEGDHLGEKAIVCNGEIFAIEGSKDYFAERLAKLIAVPRNTLITIDNSTFFVEFLAQEIEAVVYGAGHVALEVIRLLKHMDIHVTALDDREDFGDLARAAGADVVYCEDFETALPKIEGTPNTYNIIVTRGHSSDEACLRHVLNGPYGYVGMIGSKYRVRKTKERFLEEGYSLEQFNTVHTPIGLNIGAKTPIEIAISIIAEIIEEKNAQKAEIGYSKALLDALRTNSSEPMALMTIVERKGSAPRGLGTKMIRTASGLMHGTIGGGCVEQFIQTVAETVIASGEPRIIEADLTNDGASDRGMICGGKMKVYIEKL